MRWVVTAEVIRDDPTATRWVPVLGPTATTLNHDDHDSHGVYRSGDRRSYPTLLLAFEMARLLALVDAGAVDTVVIARLDRLTRSVADLAELLKRFKKHKVSLVSVADSLDTQSAAGRLVLNTMVSASE